MLQKLTTISQKFKSPIIGHLSSQFLLLSDPYLGGGFSLFTTLKIRTFFAKKTAQKIKKTKH
jgi:hypothetical protein